MKKYETPVIKVTEFKQDETIMVTLNSGIQESITGSLEISLNQ